MGYYISHMIGIRIGGVFGGNFTEQGWKDFKAEIGEVVREMRAEDLHPDLGDQDGDISHCLSQQLVAHKGSYVVIAGVFNYWNFEDAEELVKRLSKKLDTWVMHMAWNEEEDTMNCNVWLAGAPVIDADGNPIRRAIERIL